MVYIHAAFFICPSVSAKNRPGFLSQKPGRSYTLLVLSQALTPLLAGVLDRSLSSSQTCNGHTEGRAADVVQTNIVAELHARGVAAVLAADAQTQIGTGLAAVVGSHLDQLANAHDGRATNPNLGLGICGEHGGDPSSVEFCHNVGLDYVSCSPYRVPIARLAAAQAAIKNPRA